ncbi:pyridoxal phosphate-dependent transferase [Phyllosticta citribraziliensis]|uniref:Pyridoxal phosphate-dependent transferase n=1 Tax=Phyllosticta citribraziliensis TaxID=989973 RepID=A0ABR1L8Y4_9PEZI
MAEAALEAARARFTARNPNSKRIHDDATGSLPGGNTRSVLHTAPFPVAMKSGKGCHVVDEDDHEYVDFVGEFTAGLYGHSQPIIVETLHRTIEQVGLNLGACTAQEVQYAKLLCERFSLDRVRFCNSGTEANLHALAAARRSTGRKKVVVFEGGYHGAVLSFGHGVAANNVDASDWVLAKYNDADSARAAIAETADVAAVLVEGMQGAGGCIPARQDFLIAVQEAATKVGAIFILDEVMTSRLAPGGLQSMMGLSPDLTTLGKYLGGGLAFGAFGGREHVMRVYDPRERDALAHSGTFNNNTLAMHAGFAGLSRVYTPEASESLTRVGEDLLRRLRTVTQGTKATFTGMGSIMSLHITDSGICDAGEREDLKELFWLEMMESGFWITRRGMLALILDTPQADLDRFVDTVSAFLQRHGELLAVA